MHPVIQTLQSAMAYAEFTNADIEASTMNLIERLGADLDATASDYVPGVEVEEAEKELATELNNADTSSDDLVKALDNADAADDEIEEE